MPRPCVRTLPSRCELPSGRPLPSARLVAFGGVIGTMSRSDSRPRLDTVADTQAARRSHSSALPSIPAEAAMTALRCIPVRCGLPVCPLARDGYWPCVSGMLRRARLRSHDLPLASWGEGLPSRRTSHLLGTCPTRHAVQLAALDHRGVTDDITERASAATSRPGLALHGAGERAALVAEELAGEELRRQRGAVERHVGPAPPAARLVDCRGNQLLPCSSLALDQHRRLRGSHAL